MNRSIGYSAYRIQLAPPSSAGECHGRLYDTLNAPLYPFGFPGGHSGAVHSYRLLPPYVLYACHVSSDVWNTRSEWPASLRTTNGMRLCPPVSSRTRWARYTPETAVVGTVPDADTAQLPQSTRPVEASVRQFGWLCGSDTDGCSPVAILRAPLPW